MWSDVYDLKLTGLTLRYNKVIRSNINESNISKSDVVLNGFSVLNVLQVQLLPVPVHSEYIGQEDHTTERLRAADDSDGKGEWKINYSPLQPLLREKKFGTAWLGSDNRMSVNVGEAFSFYPTALKGCWGIVFTHGVRMGGRASGRAGGWAGGRHGVTLIWPLTLP